MLGTDKWASWHGDMLTESAEKYGRTTTQDKRFVTCFSALSAALHMAPCLARGCMFVSPRGQTFAAQPNPCCQYAHECGPDRSERQAQSALADESPGLMTTTKCSGDADCPPRELARSLKARASRESRHACQNNHVKRRAKSENETMRQQTREAATTRRAVSSPNNGVGPSSSPALKLSTGLQPWSASGSSTARNARPPDAPPSVGRSSGGRKTARAKRISSPEGPIREWGCAPAPS